MLLATALALLITGCAQQTFAISKQTGSSSTKETITIISSFLELGRRRRTVDAAKICGGAENVVKANPANIRKWIAPVFYYFRHLYSAGSAVYCSQ